MFNFQTCLCLCLTIFLRFYGNFFPSFFEFDVTQIHDRDVDCIEDRHH